MREVLAPGRLRRRYLVVVAGDDAQARRMTDGIRGVADLAALSDSAVRETGAAEQVAKVSSQRLLVVWPAFSALGDEERRRVVAHELTHAALAPVTSGRTPGWLVEGVALYVSGDRRADVAARLLAALAASPDTELTRAAAEVLELGSLAEPDAIGALGGDAQSAAYAYSSAAAFYVVERFGRKRPVRALRRLQRGGPGGATPARGSPTAPSAARWGCAWGGWSATCAAGWPRAAR